MSRSNLLLDKIEKRSAKVGVVGLGYVGLPLVVELARAGFNVIGFDVDATRAQKINEGESYIGDISSAELAEFTTQKSSKGSITATTDFSRIRELDTLSICVPTPLGKTKDPDISYILEVRTQLEKSIHAGMLLILESTTYPGTTEEVFLPMIHEAGLTVGEDFFLAFSPERIDPGNQKFKLHNTPKVVGGMTPVCTEIACALYGTIVERVVPVGSPAAAEMTKILENTFRAVNIGLVNEVAIMCKILGIDTWEVIDAAATKPFGFTPFYPGPGLGGHCIPVDPHYLSWKLRTLNYQARFIDLAAEVNTSMPHHVVNLAVDMLNDAEKSLKGSKVLVLGMAYKPDVADLRESPSLDIFKLLEEKGAKVSFHDPHADRVTIGGKKITGQSLSPELLADQDLVLIATNHSVFDIPAIVRSSKRILDTRNATQGIRDSKVVRL